jgi:5-methylcytosine-specific restriction endonuclease McrA
MLQVSHAHAITYFSGGYQMQISQLNQLSNHEVIVHTKNIVAKERGITVHFLRYLGELDARKLHEEAGYPSLFKYLTGELGFSESAAAKRSAAARAARKYPLIYDLIAKGETHLAAVYQLSRHLTAENAERILLACRGKSRDEVEVYLVTTFAKSTAVKRDHVKILAPFVKAPDQPRQAFDFGEMPVVNATETSASERSPSTFPGKVAAAAAARISVTLDEEAYADLQCAKEVSGHSELGEVIGKALKAYLAKKDPLRRPAVKTKVEKAVKIVKAVKEKREQVTSPKYEAPLKRKAAPRAIQRAVQWRDEGRCTFVSENGKRCGSRMYLELDHILPVAKGGETKIENLRLLCRVHNGLMARRHLGKEFMGRFVKESVIYW